MLNGISLLIVDDELDALEDLQAILTAKGAKVATARNGVEALFVLEKELCDICLVDLKMPQMDGMELLNRIKAEYPEIDVVILTGYGSIPSTVEAMKAGAADYLTKPINGDELLLCLDRLCRSRYLIAQNQYFMWEIEQRYQTGKLIGEHSLMQEVYRKIESAARVPSTVLITGESGTGKELVASAIHYRSDRRKKPFIKVNCGALPEDLLVSELFGHEKGAFTGAIQRRLGRFELADGGTLLLDEISTASPRVQAALLRVLQEGEFERVGGTQTLKVDVRLISATNQPLDRLITEGRFRQDLFYRLKVITIEVPPLRDRLGDIPFLVEHFLTKYQRKFQRPRLQVSASSMRILEAYSWPGNVRELEYAIESASALSANGLITPDDLPITLSKQFGLLFQSISHEKAIEAFERQLLTETLQRHNGHVAEAAKELHLSLSTLYRKLQEYQIPFREVKE
jgi:DNA-binding NtrC family response regulator